MLYSFLVVQTAGKDGSSVEMNAFKCKCSFKDEKEKNNAKFLIRRRLLPWNL